MMMTFLRIFVARGLFRHLVGMTMDLLDGIPYPWSSISPMEANLSSSREEESGFDGNRTDILVHWYYPNRSWIGFDEETRDGLMQQTVEGHLRWVLFLTKKAD